MKFVLICTLGPDVEHLRVALRGEHLSYVAAHKDRIVFGGPTIGANVRPERMLIVIEAQDLAVAKAFARQEPYGINGVFETVEVRA